jgi:transposase
MKGKSRAMKDQILRMSRDGHKIKKISIALGISKNTVRKYVRSVDSSVECLPDRLSKASYDEFIDWSYVLEQIRIGRPIKIVFQDVKPDISYAQFTRLVKARSPALLPPAAIRLQHEPGEKVQVDYCDGIKLTDPKTGKLTKTQFFCGVLPASSYVYGEFTLTQKSKDFLQSHERMWHFYGGVSKYVIIDNLKTGVSKAHRYDPDLNPAYCDFANHCGFGVLPARVKTPRDKACVESTIGVIQRDFFEKYRHHKFYSLFELNALFRSYLGEFNSRIMSDYGVSRTSRFELEKITLNPIPASKYELYEWKTAKVHPDCCIELKASVYSVPFTNIGKTVHVKFSDEIVIILDESGTETIATHCRVARYKASITQEHLPSNKIQRETFNVQRIEKFAQTIGPQTIAYVTWQLEIDKNPLQVLRRLQGLIRYYQTHQPSKESFEFASTKSMEFKQMRIRYFTQCITSFNSGKVSSNTVKPPIREVEHIYLQKQEYLQ